MGGALIAGIVLGVLSLTVTPRLLVLFFAVPIALGISSMLLRCSKCRHPVHKHYVKVFGLTWSYWGPNVPRRCPRCHEMIS